MAVTVIENNYTEKILGLLKIAPGMGEQLDMQDRAYLCTSFFGADF